MPVNSSREPSIITLPLPLPLFIANCASSTERRPPVSFALSVLLPSRQSIGGYPRLAAVVTADLGRFAQMRPGDPVRFVETTLATAHDLYLARERDLNRVRLGLARLTN